MWFKKIINVGTLPGVVVILQRLESKVVRESIELDVGIFFFE